jgi:hypothetical protein
VAATAVSLSATSPAIRVEAVPAAPAGTTTVPLADVLLAAYTSAVEHAPAACHLPVSLLAAIGQVESGSLVGRPMDVDHRTSVLGPVLDGHGYAAVPDSDQGRIDGDTVWDRAVGPMQFLPSTWRRFGVDGDHDGVADPQDVEDAAAGTAAYLCYGARDLSDPRDLRAAVLSYNHSGAYLDLVMTYERRFRRLGLDSERPLAGTWTAFAPRSVVDAAAAGRPRTETAAEPAAVPSPVASRTARPPRPTEGATSPPGPTVTPAATPTAPGPSSSPSPVTSPTTLPPDTCAPAPPVPAATPSATATPPLPTGTTADVTPTPEAPTPAAGPPTTAPDPCQPDDGSGTSLSADLGQAPTASLAAPSNASSTGPDSTG